MPIWFAAGPSAGGRLVAAAVAGSQAPSVIEIIIVVDVLWRVAGAQLRFESRGEGARGVDPASLEQLIAGGDFHQDRQIAAGRHRHPNQRDAQPQEIEERVVEPQAIVFAMRFPAFELHDQLDPLSTYASRRRRTGRAG